MNLRPVCCLLASLFATAVWADPAPVRERLLMDAGWRFAFGQQADPARDIYHATACFSSVTKAGYPDGAAAARFDGRACWRVDLPQGPSKSRVSPCPQLCRPDFIVLRRNLTTD